MVNKRSLKAVINVARTEYMRWILNPRMIILGVFMVLLYSVVLQPLFRRATDVGGSFNAIEPFIALFNSGMVMLFIPIVMLTLISDFPVMNGNTLFYISRTGKIVWYLGQILFAIMSAMSYIASIFLFSLIFSMPNGGIFLSWSEATRHYAAMFPDKCGSYTDQLLPSNLYNQLSFSDALIHTVLLSFLYLLVLFLILSLFRFLKMKMVGLVAAGAVIAFGTATCLLKIDAMWAFPMAHSITWLHFTEILSKPILPIESSYLYFAAIILILLIANVIVLKKSDFYLTEE